MGKKLQVECEKKMKKPFNILTDLDIMDQALIVVFSFLIIAVGFGALITIMMIVFQIHYWILSAFTTGTITYFLFLFYPHVIEIYMEKHRDEEN